VQLVIADTSPINYLVLIGHIGVLPSLFERVILPSVVREELDDGPSQVRLWIADRPPWVEVRATRDSRRDASLHDLDAGEEDAIALAVELHADLLLMDDREGVLAARSRGLTVTGTLGVLGLAARHGLLDLAEAFGRIRRTNFRYRQDTMDALLAEASGTASTEG
jgi:predicted nucleic acid-binding protein